MEARTEGGRPEAAVREDACTTLHSADLIEEASSLYSNQKRERRLLQASEMLIHKEIRGLVLLYIHYTEMNYTYTERLLSPIEAHFKKISLRANT